MSTPTPTEQALQDEIAALRRQLAEAQQAHRKTEQRAQLYEALLEDLPINTAIWHLDDPADPTSFRLTFVNYHRNTINSSIDMKAEVGRRISEVLPSLSMALLQRYVDALHLGKPSVLGEVPFNDERIGAGVVVIRAIPLPNDHLCLSIEDVTERKRAEEALKRRAEQDEMIRAQQATLAELSTPLIPISEQVMVMPLIGAIDSHRAQQVIETLLTGISQSGASVVILDITGVAVVDTQVASVLLRAAQSVKLLGARVVLTGIRPEVAQTLVGLGADLSVMTTMGSLRDGIALALRQNNQTLQRQPVQPAYQFG
jgi:rsbT co-antagonist protein RsbR